MEGKYKKFEYNFLFLQPDKDYDKIMWQRIQTLYLGIGAALLFSLFFCTMATILGPDGTEETVAYTDKAVLLAMNIICLAGELFCIFCFKNRRVQMWLTTFLGIVLVGYESLLAAYFFLLRGEMVFSFTAVFPIVAAILNFMATARIMHDEAVVQASNHLRSSRRKKRR